MFEGFKAWWVLEGTCRGLNRYLYHFEGFLISNIVSQTPEP